MKSRGPQAAFLLFAHYIIDCFLRFRSCAFAKHVRGKHASVVCCCCFFIISHIVFLVCPPQTPIICKESCGEAPYFQKKRKRKRARKTFTPPSASNCDPSTPPPLSASNDDLVENTRSCIIEAIESQLRAIKRVLAIMH